jgi:hypothetical protein
VTPDCFGSLAVLRLAAAGLGAHLTLVAAETRDVDFTDFFFLILPDW